MASCSGSKPPRTPKEASMGCSPTPVSTFQLQAPLQPILRLRSGSVEGKRLVSLDKLPPRVNPEDWNRVPLELREKDSDWASLKRDNEFLSAKVADLQICNNELARRLEESHARLRLLQSRRCLQPEGYSPQQKSNGILMQRCGCHVTIESLQRSNGHLQQVIAQLNSHISRLRLQAQSCQHRPADWSPLSLASCTACKSKIEALQSARSAHQTHLQLARQKIESQAQFLSSLQGEVLQLRRELREVDGRTLVETKQVCLLDVKQHQLCEILLRLGIQCPERLECKSVSQFCREAQLDFGSARQTPS